MGQKTKKPFYKKWWVWLIAIIIIGGIFSTGDSEESNNSSNESDTQEIQNSTTEQPKEEVAEEPKEEVKEETKKEEVKDTKMKQGTYKVGTDLPAGEYIVFADSLITYYESASDSSGSLESIIFNGNLSDNAHAYVTVQDGEYFKVTGGYFYPVDEAPSVIPESGVYEDGMYKVGKDIPAGEYKVILVENITGFGYLEVSSNSRHDLMDIVTNEMVQADTYITVKDGQYLTLQDLKIETK